MSRAFEAMAQQLGADAAMRADLNRQAIDDTTAAIAYLRSSGDPRMLRTAAKLEQALGSKGPALKLLGIRIGRGQRNRVPARARMRALVEVEVHALAMETGETVAQRQAAVVARWIAEQEPRTFILRTLEPYADVPTSEDRLACLIRAIEPTFAKS